MRAGPPSGYRDRDLTPDRPAMRPRRGGRQHRRNRVPVACPRDPAGEDEDACGRRGFGVAAVGAIGSGRAGAPAVDMTGELRAYGDVPMPEDLRAELDRLFRAGSLGGILGFRLVDWSPGRAVAELQPTAAVTNITGSVHGGVLYTLADAAFEVAC